MPGKKGSSTDGGERFFSDEDDYYDDPSILRRKTVIRRHQQNQRKKYFSDSEEEDDHSKDKSKGWSQSISNKKELNENVDKINQKEQPAEPVEIEDIVELQGSTVTKENVGIMGISRVFKNSLLDGKNLKPTDFRKVASLHLQRKGIISIMKDAFSQFATLAHLYLYENNLTRMTGLQDLRRLETLHLSGNRIRRIENLENASNLRQLYLGNNEIAVVQGLENLTMLVELHVENQRLPPGTSLIIDAQTSQALADTLRVLNISGNQLQDINDLVGMNGLDTLNLANNELKDLDLVVVVLKDLMQLRNLNLSENTVKKHPQYKEKLIGQCNYLELLDGKGVNYMQKQALQKMCLVKERRAHQKLQYQKMAKSMQELWAKYQQGSQQLPSTSTFGSQSLGPQGFGIRSQKPMAQRVLRGPPQRGFVPPGFLPQRGVGSRAMPSPMAGVPGFELRESPENPHDQFVYSTPVRSSPVHFDGDSNTHVPVQESASHETTVGSEVLDTSHHQDPSIVEAYERRAGLPSPNQDTNSKMSEMAKIIFRLSNLSPSSSYESVRGSGREGAGAGYWGQGQTSSARWNRPPTFKEARPLSPLEIDVGQSPRFAPSLGGSRKAVPLRRPMAKKLPSRGNPGTRMLSPLEELPTPDSIMGMDGGDWTSDVFLNVKP